MNNKPHKQKIKVETLDDLALAWSKEAFCNCEIEKIEEHECPFDQDECNCCAWCEKECGKLKTEF